MRCSLSFSNEKIFDEVAEGRISRIRRFWWSGEISACEGLIPGGGEYWWGSCVSDVLLQSTLLVLRIDLLMPRDGFVD